MSFEFLPGLGAFPLRPDHADDDAAKLETFVTRVLRHVAGAATRHNRATYWAAKAYAGGGTDASGAMPPAGDLPPADTPVLFGYVRSDEQWAWIRRAKLYNVRSGQRAGAVETGDLLLDAPLVLLYGREAWREASRALQACGRMARHDRKHASAPWLCEPARRRIPRNEARADIQTSVDRSCGT